MIPPGVKQESGAPGSVAAPASEPPTLRNVETNGYGVFFNLWVTTPVIHRFDFDRKPTEPNYSAEFTACGRCVSEYDHETHKLTEHGMWMPIRHARKIGRPCAVCFPVVKP